MSGLRHFNGLANMVVDCEGEGREKARGLVTTWKQSIVIDIKSQSLHHIDVEVTKIASEKKWQMSCLYGFPKGPNKLLTCELIQSLYIG